MIRGPVTCRCGDQFERHPAFEVPCPTCGAKVGQVCKRPSEHEAAEPHKERRQLAWNEKPCSCLTRWLEAQGEKRREFVRKAEWFPSMWEKGEEELEAGEWITQEAA